jgi:hypothetical protein
VLADINASMLRVGRDRLLDRGVPGNLYYVQADAQYLPFPDDHFDCITIAFGLRNVTDKDLALRSMLRVLKPGGRLLVLEFSKPRNALLSKAYDAYSFGVMPLMGRLVTGDRDSYQYLAESIRVHPDQETLRADDGGRGLRPLRLPQHDRRRGGGAPRYQGLNVSNLRSPTLHTAGLAAAEAAANAALRLSPHSLAALLGPRRAGGCRGVHGPGAGRVHRRRGRRAAALRGVHDGDVTTRVSGSAEILRNWRRRRTPPRR